MIKALGKADAEAAKKAAAVAHPVVEFLDEVEVEPVQFPLKLCLFDLDDILAAAIPQKLPPGGFLHVMPSRPPEVDASKKNELRRRTRALHLLK